MTLYLVRHAQAGSRSTWTGDDHLRPLNERGLSQSDELVKQLHDARFDRILSSPYTRCMQTVVPLAAAHNLALEPDPVLGEGTNLPALIDLVAATERGGAVLCSHGDVIPDLLGHFSANAGLELGPDPKCQKGSTWVIEMVDGQPISARYLPPPDR